MSTTCGATLAPGGTCSISVHLTTTAVTAFTGTLSVTTSAGVLTSVLTGTGTAPSLIFQPGSTNWGTIGVASDSGDWPVIKNNSTLPLLLTAHSLASGPAGAWSWQGDSTHCQPGVTVLQPGGTCQTFFGTGTLATPGSYTATDQISYQVSGHTTTTFTTQQTYTFAMAATTSTPASLAFGNVKANTTSASQTFTLKNNATGSPVNISVTTTGAQAANFPVSNTCGTNLAAGASCTVTVSFNPATIGTAYSAAVQVATTYPRMHAGAVEAYFYPAPVFSMPVTGTGAGSQLTFSPASYTFANHATGTAAATTATILTNTGNAPTTGLATAISGGAGATISGCAADLAPTAACVLTVSWAPTVAGSFSGAVTASSPAGTSTNSFAWSGTATTPPTATASLAFGNNRLNVAATQVATFTNNAAVAATVTVPSATSVSGNYFSFAGTTCGATLAAGASCTVTVQFDPTVLAMGDTGALTIASSEGSTTTALSGNGSQAQLGFSPSPVVVPALPANQSTNVNVTITNTGNIAAGPNFSYGLGTSTGPVSLGMGPGCESGLGNPGTSCVLQLTFGGNGIVGTGSGTVSATVANGPTGYLNWSVTTVAPTLTLTQSGVDFGNVTVGQPSATTFVATLSNTGSAAVTVTPPVDGTPNVSTDTGFHMRSTTCGGTLAAHSSCTVSMYFVPKAVGVQYGELNLWIGSSVILGVAFSGTGVQPAILPFTIQSGGGLTTVFQNPNAAAVTPTAAGITALQGDTSLARVTANTCQTSVAAGGTCTITFAAPLPQCQAEAYTVEAFVTDLGGTATGSQVSRTTKVTNCQ